MNCPICQKELIPADVTWVSCECPTLVTYSTTNKEYTYNISHYYSDKFNYTWMKIPPYRISQRKEFNSTQITIDVYDGDKRSEKLLFEAPLMSDEDALKMLDRIMGLKAFL